MSMTKEQLALLGIKVDKEELTDDEIADLITKKFQEKDSEIKNQKDLISKRNSEIADYKRKETDKLSEDEKTKLHYEEIEKLNQELSRKIAMSERVANYVGIGYSKELAEKVASAELDGKDVSKYHAEFIKQKETEIQANLLKNTPTPNTNTQSETITKEKFNKMGYEDLLKLQKENPTLYEELSKN